jgi:hypothetical protein
MNRHNRRALNTIARRLHKGIARVRSLSTRGFNGPLGEQARIHVATLWTRYAKLTNDTSVL